MSFTRIPFILDPENLKPVGSTQMPIIVLMVDDQPILGEGVRRMLAKDAQIHFHFCQYAEQALQKALELKPTVILQDLIMPDMDGLTLLKQFKENPLTAEIPMIMLSARDEPQIKHQCFALGANDYIVKFPDPLEMIARIRYHSEAYNLGQERIATYAALNASQQALRAELDQAKHYVLSLLPQPYEDTRLRTNSVLVCSTILGGDAFGHHWIDDDHFAVYLLDVCGHGVGAALMSVSVLNVMRFHGLPNVDFRDPAAVLGGLNVAFDMEKQNQMYFTLWYGVYQRSTRTLKYSSGGHPPAILVQAKPAKGQESVKKLKTPGLVVGAMPESTYVSKEVTVQPADRLYVFSDGVYEIQQSHSGAFFSLEECIKLLEHPQTNKVQNVLEKIRTIQGNHHFEDDFSLLEVLFK